MIRALLFVVVLAGCAPTPPAPSQVAAPRRWMAVLVAGDGSIPVFDNATGRMAALMEAVGTAPGDIHRFSASPDMLARPMVQVASKRRVLDAIDALRPQPGQACLLFMTSHGARGEGLYLAARGEFLSPPELDAALNGGCGGSPTVAVVSGCYSGGFAASPMARPNRIVLAAAAADRPSFGCDAGKEFTFYDECLLRSLGALPRDWPEVVANTGRCVAALEQRDGERASMPQSAVGDDVVGLAVPG